ncbi:hypothetical protein ABIA30_001204 [Mycobacterium sp. MAA66]
MPGAAGAPGYAGRWPHCLQRAVPGGAAHVTQRISLSKYVECQRYWASTSPREADDQRVSRTEQGVSENPVMLVDRTGDNHRPDLRIELGAPHRRPTIPGQLVSREVLIHRRDQMLRRSVRRCDEHRARCICLLQLRRPPPNTSAVPQQDSRRLHGCRHRRRRTRSPKQVAALWTSAGRQTRRKSAVPLTPPPYGPRVGLSQALCRSPASRRGLLRATTCKQTVR